MRTLGVAATICVAFWGCATNEFVEPLAPWVGDASSVVPDSAPIDVVDGSKQAVPATNDAAIDSADAAPADPRDRPGIFAGVGNLVRHIRSLDDGKTWVDDATDIPATMMGDFYGIRTVSWGNGMFVAFAAKVVTSPDGKIWTDVPKTSGQWLASMLHAEGQWVSSGGYGWLATATTDLGTWTQHPPVDDYTTAHHSRGALAYGKVNGASAYVVVNDDGKIFHAVDGKTWQPSTGPVVPAGNTWGTVFAYGNGVFVGVLPTGKDTIRSVDGGATWTANAPLSTAAQGIVYAQGRFTALAAGYVFTSTDGQTWAQHVAPTSRAADIFYGHGTYLALDDGAIFRSTDGLAWTQVFDNGANPNRVASIAFGPM